MRDYSDLLTARELEDLATRYQIRYLLYKGKTYREISALLGVSHQTIAKVRKLEKERGKER